jgi:hypothetical protein
MARYICAKCGMGADSKCANSRSVFPDNEMDAAYSHYFHGEVSGGWAQASFNTFEGDDARKAFTNLRNYLTRVLESNGGENDPPTLEQWLCDHDWELVSPKCELGCCTKK